MQFTKIKLIFTYIQVEPPPNPKLGDIWLNPSIFDPTLYIKCFSVDSNSNYIWKPFCTIID